MMPAGVGALIGGAVLAGIAGESTRRSAKLVKGAAGGSRCLGRGPFQTDSVDDAPLRQVSSASALLKIACVSVPNAVLKSEPISCKCFTPLEVPKDEEVIVANGRVGIPSSAFLSAVTVDVIDFSIGSRGADHAAEEISDGAGIACGGGASVFSWNPCRRAEDSA
jgi:hypothetical protein